MTAIFISHSSADNEAAAQMRTWLKEQGHTSLFLDFDPDGIQTGSDWEETLYYHLRQCQAVVALLTPNWLASKWCFAELVQAREKGKAIFPVIVQPCDASGIFGDTQQLDLTDQSDEGYRRLAIALKQRGLDPRDVFDWDPKRPPYPGLRAFQEVDAAIYFGRGEEVLNGLEALDALHRRGRGAPRFVLFLGASGSGKSSLVRAGLIPRLKKMPHEWLPLVPFRPQNDPLEELALSFADTFRAFGQPRDWGEIRRTLKAAAGQEPADGKILLALAHDLAIAAEQRETTVVLTIDQAEELFSYSAPEAATQFLRLLRAALEVSDRQLMAVATLRSDFLGEFQTHPILHEPAYDHDFAYQAIPVDPMPERNFAEIIQGPARLAGLRLEEGLVEAMVSDTGTRDALPLLAFTLRRLYELYGADGLLKIRDYDGIGRLEGAIRTEAERVLKDAAPSPEELQALRAAFVPAMVRINADGGYARRRAYTEEMPARARALCQRFIEARLLVSGLDKDNRETLEVAHEALLRTWPQLTAWLTEDQDNLRLLESLHRAAEDWDNGGRTGDLLIHRDGRLQDAEMLVTNQRFALHENSLKKRYLVACIDAQHARELAQQEVQERRVRDAERIAEEQKKAAGAQKKTAQRTMAGLVVAVTLALAAGWQYWEADLQAEAAEAERDRALSSQSRRLAALANDLIDVNEYEAAILLARYALIGDLTNHQKRPYTWESADALFRALKPFRTQLLTLPEPADAFVSFIAGGTQVLTVQEKGGWSIWDARTGKRLRGFVEQRGDRIRSVAIAGDEPLILTASHDGARLWNGKSDGEGKRFGPRDPNDRVLSVAFSSDRTRILTAQYYGTTRVWNIETGQEHMRLPPDSSDQRTDDPIVAAVFAANDTRIITASRKEALIWETASRNQIGASISFKNQKDLGLAVSADGKGVVVPSRDSIRLIDTSTGDTLRLESSTPDLVAAAVGADGLSVPMVPEKKMPSVWRLLADKMFVRFAAADNTAHGSPLSIDRTRLLTLTDKFTATVWDAKAHVPIARQMGKGVRRASFNADSTRLVTGTATAATIWDVQARMVKLFDLHGRSRANKDIHDNEIAAAHCGTEGARLVSYDVDRHEPPTPHVWDSGTNSLVTLEGDFKEWQAQRLQGFFTGDGSQVALGSQWGSKRRIFDVASGVELTESVTAQTLSAGAGNDTAAKDLAVSPDGQLVIIALGDTAEVRRQGRDEVTVLKGHSDAITDAAFSADGTLIVTASRDNTARVWETSTGNVVDILEDDGGDVLCASFAKQDDQVITASSGGTVRRWDVARFRSFADVIEHARLVAPRDLSEQEKKTYALPTN